MIWCESICNDQEIINQTIKKANLANPDYNGIDAEAVILGGRRVAWNRMAHESLIQQRRKNSGPRSAVDQGDHFGGAARGYRQGDD